MLTSSEGRRRTILRDKKVRQTKQVFIRCSSLQADNNKLKTLSVRETTTELSQRKSKRAKLIGGK